MRLFYIDNNSWDAKNAQVIKVEIQVFKIVRLFNFDNNRWDVNILL